MTKKKAGLPNNQWILVMSFQKFWNTKIYHPQQSGQKENQYKTNKLVPQNIAQHVYFKIYILKRKNLTHFRQYTRYK